MENSSFETAFFEACERRDLTQAKELLERNHVEEGRRLHLAVLAGNRDLLYQLMRPQFINERNEQGDTALHLAVRKYRVDLVTPLLNGEAFLSLANNKGETPLCIAVKLGFLDVIKKLVDHQLQTVQKLCKDKEVLHLAVELNRVKIVEFLTKESEIIKELINQRAGKKRSDNEGKRDKESVNSQPIVEGDTPLHIAARNKNEPIVDLLRKVGGVNKHALNSEGKTPLDVAREVTDYHESFRIIKKLTDYPSHPKPFMYCAPEVSQEKHKKAKDMVNKSFDDKRSTELVVAALLATMTFTAIFTVPGGFHQDPDKDRKDLGSPVLIDFTMFKVFIIFDCIAFFLALFVCIMWQMASELTTEDKMLFMTVSSFLVCLSFGFNSWGFMAAVYTILAHKVETLAWVVLGSLLFIALCSGIAFIHQAALFVVARARFHRLCGVPRLFDHIVESVWERAEQSGLLNIIRCLDEKSHDALEGDVEKEDEHAYNCSCSSSPCLRNVPHSV